ncbi:hypothetical protein SKAU_G00105870 [Synaphobranchus kaupii]|uniref:Uncharacterized protein n=1 Tax=Synaphobranchus kaupii TaxID=118154 RepID=A0A9Q1G049_SYNKA|nr:hypothetical protein SKAU_G00105870 [Synaphobranchus kaupii]
MTRRPGVRAQDIPFATHYNVPLSPMKRGIHTPSDGMDGRYRSIALSLPCPQLRGTRPSLAARRACFWNGAPVPPTPPAFAGQ